MPERQISGGGSSSLSSTDALLAEATAGMELDPLPVEEDMMVESVDRNGFAPVPIAMRPWDRITQHGPPADPIPFLEPRIFRGRRENVLCYCNNHDEAGRPLKDVLFRVDDDIQRAYWALPYKEPIKTIMGHVQVCVVLTRYVSVKDSDDDSESENEDDDEEIVFQMTSEFVAIKVNYWSRIQRLRGRHAEDPMKEISAMQIIGNQHPNVLGCTEVLIDNENNVNVILPFLNGGDLFQVLQESQRSVKPGMNEGLARFWFRQVCAGLQHLHAVGICHRDLSPENVMIDGKRACLIIDMGMALRVPYSDPHDPTGVVDVSQGNQKRLVKPQGACGKLPYMSPEIYRNQDAFDGGAVDVWTAGTILFCMLTGNRSYQRAHKSDPQFYYMTRDLPLLLADWRVELTPEAVDLLKGMMQVDPRDRLTLEEVLAHPWFSHPDIEPE